MKKAPKKKMKKKAVKVIKFPKVDLDHPSMLWYENWIQVERF